MRYLILYIACVSYSMLSHYNNNYIFDCFAVSNSVFFLLVIRGVPGLIFAQTQVSAPLNSRPVIGYRKGRATPIWSPAWSGGYVRCVARGLTHGSCKRLRCSLTVYL